MSYVVDGVNGFCHYAEMALNIADIIPGVNSYSRPIRHTAGLVQAVAGLVLAAVGQICMRTSRTTWDRDDWWQFSRFGDNHLIHGVANVAFAALSAYAFTMTPAGAAWAILAIYNAKHTWKPVISYFRYQEEGNLKASIGVA